MPDARLRRARATLPEGYQYGENMRSSVEPIPCGHRSQIGSRFTLVTLPDGTTERERIPQRFRVRAADARFCFGCGQFVDAIDEAEALEDNGWRAPHENAAAQLKRRQQMIAERVPLEVIEAWERRTGIAAHRQLNTQRTGDEAV